MSVFHFIHFLLLLLYFFFTFHTQLNSFLFHFIQSSHSQTHIHKNLTYTHTYATIKSSWWCSLLFFFFFFFFFYFAFNFLIIFHFISFRFLSCRIDQLHNAHTLSLTQPKYVYRWECEKKSSFLFWFFWKWFW